MAHVLFVDMSQAGLHTMRRAVELGHQVSFIRGESMRFYQEDDEFHRLLTELDEVRAVHDTTDADALTEAIAALHADRPVDAVISQCDPMLEALAVACERLGLPFTSARGIRNARHKARARDLLAAAGQRSARYRLVTEPAAAVVAAEQIGYPVVVKPVSGMDSVLAQHAATESAVFAATAEIQEAAGDPGAPEPVRRMLSRGILVEEYLRGELVSAEIGVLSGQSYHLGLCGRSRGRDNDCVEMGAVLPGNVSEHEAEECYRYAEAVCRILGLDLGVFHVELILTDDGPVLVEVNPRVMGGVMTRLYEILTGQNFCDFVIDLHLGVPPRPVPMRPGRTVTARRLLPRADGRLAEHVDLSFVTDQANSIVSFETFHLAPNTPVRRQQLLGRYAVVADTWAEAMTRADGLIELFEQAIGVPLMTPAPAGSTPSWKEDP